MTSIEKTILSAHVREALKQWGSDVSAASSLRHLASFRRLQLERYSEAAMVQPDNERQIQIVSCITPFCVYKRYTK